MLADLLTLTRAFAAAGYDHHFAAAEAAVLIERERGTAARAAEILRSGVDLTLGEGEVIEEEYEAHDGDRWQVGQVLFTADLLVGGEYAGSWAAVSWIDRGESSLDWTAEGNHWQDRDDSAAWRLAARLSRGELDGFGRATYLAPEERNILGHPDTEAAEELTSSDAPTWQDALDIQRLHAWAADDGFRVRGVAIPREGDSASCGLSPELVAHLDADGVVAGKA